MTQARHLSSRKNGGILDSRVFWEEMKEVKVLGVGGLLSYDQFGDEGHK